VPTDAVGATDPVAAEPTPTDSAIPVYPAPSDPISGNADPAPVNPTPTDPVVAGPPPTDPIGSVDPAPSDPVPLSEPAPVTNNPGGSAYPATSADPVGSNTTDDPLVAAPTNEAEPQPPPPIPESVGLEAAPVSEPTHSSSAAEGFAAESLAATAAKLADEVVEKVTDMVKAVVLGADERASKTVKELIERVGDLVSALLLVGNGASGASEGLVERVANVVSDVAHTLGGLLGVGGTPAPADYYHLAGQPLAAFYQDYEQATAELIERSAAAVGELTRAVSGALSGGGAAPNQEAGGVVPATPPPAAPSPLVPVAPGGYSSSSVVVGSGSAGEAFQLLFAVLVLFSVALLKGGRLSRLRREAHGPPTAFTLAIERPG
jgi:hypothetical protein